MTIKATSQISIADLNDAKVLSGYLTSNIPKVQIYDPNKETYNPSWTGDGNLKLTPVLFLNQSVLTIGATGLSVEWKKKEGLGSEVSLDTAGGETVLNGVLTVKGNKLADVTSGLITYVCKVRYQDPDTNMISNISIDITYSLLRMSINAKLVDITGEQVFGYDAEGVVNPKTIELTANLTNVTMAAWHYKNADGSWLVYPGSSNAETLTIKPTDTVFTNNSVSIKATTSDDAVFDVMTIHKVKDGVAGGQGQAGKDAYTLVLSNEAFLIPTGNDNKVSTAIIYKSNVIAYKGASKITPTVGTATGMPSGMTIEKGVAANNEIPLTIKMAKGTVLTGDNGIITIPVSVDTQSFTKQLVWSKAKTGSDGVNAVVLQIIAPKGRVFINQEGKLDLEAIGYDGSNEVAGATYQWFEYRSNVWTAIPGGTTKLITIDGSTVKSLGSFKCTMSYKGKDYSDVVTLEDKSDSMLASIISTGGDVFKNTVGTSKLIAKLFQNGLEVDELKSTHIGTEEPAKVAGAFWYKQTGKNIELHKYVGSAWVVAPVGDQHKYTYEWYRRDKDGEPVAEDEGVAFKTGKVIYIDGDDVDLKTTFICEIK